MGAIHKCTTKIIPYVLTCDGVVTKFHKSYSKQIGLSLKIEAYIQYIVLKKTLESISFDYRRNGDEAILGTQESASVKSENGEEPNLWIPGRWTVKWENKILQIINIK